MKIDRDELKAMSTLKTFFGDISATCKATEMCNTILECPRRDESHDTVSHATPEFPKGISKRLKSSLTFSLRISP